MGTFIRGNWFFPPDERTIHFLHLIHKSPRSSKMMKKVASFLMGGLVIGLLASQSLMDLFLALTTLWGLWLLIKENQARQIVTSPPLKQWWFFALIWCGWICLGLLIRTSEVAAVGPALQDFIWLLQLPLLVLLWKHLQPQAQHGKWFLILLSLTAGYAVIVYFLGFDPLQQSWQDREQNLAFWRTGGFFSNPMPLAHSYGPLLSLLIPLGLFSLYGLYLKKLSWSDSPIVKWCLVAVALTFLAVLFTFTRGVWLALVLSTLVGAFIFSRRLGIVSVLLMTLMGALLMAGWPKFRERTLQAFDPQKSYDSERVLIWTANWMMFKDHPVAGVGYGQNKNQLRGYYDRMNLPADQFTSHAHNQYLQALAGTGLVGFLFYFGCMVLFLILTYRLYSMFETSKDRERALFVLGLLMAQLTFYFGSFTEANFTIAKNRYLLVFLWSLVIYAYLEYSPVSRKIKAKA